MMGNMTFNEIRTELQETIAVQNSDRQMRTTDEFLARGDIAGLLAARRAEFGGFEMMSLIGWSSVMNGMNVNALAISDARFAGSMMESDMTSTSVLGVPLIKRYAISFLPYRNL